MIISVEHICKSYKKNVILKDISFEAESGECVGFVGANGCGKTTLLSILVGVEKADRGSIKKKTRKIGYVPQINPLPDNLTVKECLKLWCDNKAEYDEIVSRYELSEFLSKRINRLSGGMKRRVAIACAMMGSPDILVMDEPTAALDINYKKLIHNDMKTFVNNGGLIIMVTHEAEEISMCGRCYEIRDGLLKEYAPNN